MELMSATAASLAESQEAMQHEICTINADLAAMVPQVRRYAEANPPSADGCTTRAEISAKLAMICRFISTMRILADASLTPWIEQWSAVAVELQNMPCSEDPTAALPDELLLMIFAWLDTSATNLPGVCKLWSRLLGPEYMQKLAWKTDLVWTETPPINVKYNGHCHIVQHNVDCTFYNLSVIDLENQWYSKYDNVITFYSTGHPVATIFIPVALGRLHMIAQRQWSDEVVILYRNTLIPLFLQPDFTRGLRDPRSVGICPVTDRVAILGEDFIRVGEEGVERYNHIEFAIDPAGIGSKIAINPHTIVVCPRDSADIRVFSVTGKHIQLHRTLGEQSDVLWYSLVALPTQILMYDGWNRIVMALTTRIPDGRTRSDTAPVAHIRTRQLDYLTQVTFCPQSGRVHLYNPSKMKHASF
jgi:hypothetical protein